MYVAFNAGLPIGDDWRAAAAAVVDAHLRASAAAAASPRPNCARVPTRAHSDHHRSGRVITTKKPHRSVSVPSRRRHRTSSAELSLLARLFLEPIHPNSFRSPRVFTEPTCAIPDGIERLRLRLRRSHRSRLVSPCAQRHSPDQARLDKKSKHQNKRALELRARTRRRAMTTTAREEETLTEYELQRLAHVRRNREYMARLGVTELARDDDGVDVRDDLDDDDEA